MIVTWLRRSSMTLGLALLAANAASAQDSGIEVGLAAPAAALHTLNGKLVNLSDYIGKQPVLMEFWATWCPNCKELEPTMKALHEKYGKQISFLNIAVSVNQSPALANRYVANHKLPGVQLYDTRGDATQVYDVPATSYVVLVDKTGKIVYTGMGGKQPDLEKAIKKLM